VLRKRTRHWIEVVTVLAVVAAIGGTWWYLHYRTDHTTTAISVEEVLRDYRRSTQQAATPISTTPSPTTATPPAPATTTAGPSPSAAPPPPVQPAAGVYRYTTTGSDAVDALGGASHQYPATTTIAVTVEGCATTQRWTAAEERWDELATCGGNGAVQLQRFTSFHRFFGTDDTETFACDGEPRPVGAPAGTTWTARCVNGDETATWTGTVVGDETATVGGSTVDVDHVVVTIVNGDARDTQRTDTWYLAGTDLVVRRISDIVTTEGSPIGDVDYTEHYEIALDSLSPLG
jgi:hypothetical protein